MPSRGHFFVSVCHRERHNCRENNHQLTKKRKKTTFATMNNDATPKPKDRRPLPQQHKRSHRNNYHGRGIYMLTLCTEDRQPLLGHLIGESPETASVVPTPLGEAVLKCWDNIPTLQKDFAQKKSERTGQRCKRDLSLIACQLMPDHFHGILFVRSEMDIAVGDVVRGFMVGCTKAYNESLSTPVSEGHTLKPLWEKGYHDRLLLHAGQLQNMIAYVKDNPRRLMLKKMHPGCFAVQRNVQWERHCFSAVGNLSLLDHPLYAVHVRSHYSDDEARDYMNACILAARNGAALIGAFISPKEKQVQEAAIKERLPVICLVVHGFSEYYKPVGSFMEACSRGLMLFLTEASDETRSRKGITRKECEALNALAEEMAISSQ